MLVQVPNASPSHPTTIPPPACRCF
jgi:hypothetical protein